MSTSPTLISWRTRSSVSTLSSPTRLQQGSTGCCWHECRGTRTIRRNSNSSQPKPEKLIGPQRQEIRSFRHSRKKITAKHLDRNPPLVTPQVEFHRLGGAGKIIYHQNCFIGQLANIRQHSMVGGIEKFYGARAEHRGGTAHPYDLLHPGKQRVLAAL